MLKIKHLHPYEAAVTMQQLVFACAGAAVEFSTRMEPCCAAR
jgi:hypothetical protein